MLKDTFQLVEIQNTNQLICHPMVVICLYEYWNPCMIVITLISENFSMTNGSLLNLLKPVN